MKNTISLSLILIAMLLVANAKELPNISDVYAQYAGLDLSNGVDKEEAIHISRIYIRTFGTPVDSTYGELRESNNQWYMPLINDFSNNETDLGVYINKETGKITNSRGHPMNSPIDLWKK